MSAGGYERAHAWAAHWAQRWFLGTDGEDRLAVSGAPQAGWATHVEAYLLLNELAQAELGLRRDAPSLARRLKGLGLDRLLRALALRAIGGAPSDTGAMGGVVLVAEIPTPSMLEPLQLVAAALPATAATVAAADPRALRRLRAAGIPARPLTLPLSEERRTVRTEGPAYLEALAMVQRAPPRMLLGGSDVTRAAMHVLGRSLARSLPWVAVEHRAVERLVDRVRPRSIAVASDQHRIGRLVTGVASLRGVPVTVLQHGLPQSEVGYLPVVADGIAAWSPASAAWFTERGTDASRVEVLGNPRFDALARTRPDADPPAGRDELHLLLALSPTGRGTNERVLATALRALASQPNDRLVVKLHPGHREWGWVRRAVSREAPDGRVSIAHRQSLGPLLRQANVVLVHRSSVALEAVAAGLPIVVLDSDQPSIADIELSDLGLSSVADAASLSEALEPLRTPDGRAAWLSARRPAIDRHTGPTDGRSAQRIAAALLGAGEGS